MNTSDLLTYKDKNGREVIGYPNHVALWLIQKGHFKDIVFDSHSSEWYVLNDGERYVSVKLNNYDMFRGVVGCIENETDVGFDDDLVNSVIAFLAVHRAND